MIFKRHGFNCSLTFDRSYDYHISKFKYIKLRLGWFDKDKGHWMQVTAVQGYGTCHDKDIFKIMMTRTLVDEVVRLLLTENTRKLLWTQSSSLSLQDLDSGSLSLPHQK